MFNQTTFDKPFLGIEIGNGNLKLAFLKNKRLADVQTYSTCENNGTIENPHEFPPIIKKYHEQHKLSKLALVTVKTSTAIVRFIKSPILKEKDLNQMVERNIGDIFPFDIKNFVFDYKVISQDSVMTLMVCCLPKEIALNICKIVEQSGLILGRLDIYPNSLSAAFETLCKKDVQFLNAAAITDYGNILSLIFFKEGKLLEIINLKITDVFSSSYELKKMIALYAQSISTICLLTKIPWVLQVIEELEVKNIYQNSDELALIGLLCKKL